MAVSRAVGWWSVWQDVSDIAFHAGRSLLNRTRVRVHIVTATGPHRTFSLSQRQPQNLHDDVALLKV
jgi:hypothetical protein